MVYFDFMRSASALQACTAFQHTYGYISSTVCPTLPSMALASVLHPGMTSSFVGGAQC